MVPMDLAQQTSPSTLLTSLLSLYLLSDPPSPSCALPTIITLIAEKKPFQTIESNSPALHKWNTRVSSLLQSKSAESRFWGVCLVKASVENGGEGLGHVVVWSKLLLTLLNRPEASVLLERAMATLTCVFGLISTHPALSRELNTMLPVFFIALLNSTSQKSLLEPALKALHALIPEHATTFRPNLGKVNQLTLSIIEGDYTPDNQKLAAKVYVDLHHSAQKGTGREHWRSCLVGTISEIHSILDRLFEIVEEDRRLLPAAKPIGLKPLEGEYGNFSMRGIERIHSLVMVIEQFLSLPTKQQVNLPLGHLVDLTLRVYSVGVDTRSRDGASKQDISLLFSNLSTLYTQMNTIISASLKCVGKSFAPHFRPILTELIANLTTSDTTNSIFRISSYNLLTNLIHNFGAGLHSTIETKSLDALSKSVSRDIATLFSSFTIPSLSTSTKSRKRKHNANQPIEVRATTSTPPTTQITSAINLIIEILRLTPILSISTRSTIDHVILSAALQSVLPAEIVCALHRAIVTGILFPGAIAVIPHALRILERDYGSKFLSVRDSAVRGLAELEGMIHPRLPAQRGSVIQRGREDTEEDEEVNEEQEEVLHREGSGDMIMEERVVEEVTTGQENSAPESLKPAVEPELQKTGIQSAVPSVSLPSFVHTTHTAPPSAFISTNVTSMNSELTSQTATLSPISTTMERKSGNRAHDIFNTGAWKQIQKKDQEEDEEEDEIPEIDMDFDSDEE